ncbi:unnamed protein product [Sphagnum jensenii]|uniref:26S proteasome non-ATPase regulatory subunit 2 n=1 Tax=Sphagnum jensenii TaxID=128206 RepID=A0ABP1ABF8_9BRYO
MQACALLFDSVNKEDPAIRIGVIMGLGLAYPNTQKEEVLEVLIPIVQDSKVGIEVAGFAAMTLGLVYVGSCNEDVAQSIVLSSMEHTERGLDSHQAPALLGIALVAMTKELGLDIAIQHLFQYGEQNIRWAVPLALGILPISNPKAPTSYLVGEWGNRDGCTELT